MKHIKSFNEATENLNISGVMFSESKISTFEEKPLEDILFDINKCNGEDGMKTLVKLQSLWTEMDKSNKKSKVLNAIKKRLKDIGF